MLKKLLDTDNDGLSSRFKILFGQEQCSGDYDEGGFKKDLKVFFDFQTDYDKTNTLIVDDSPDKFDFYQNNMIHSNGMSGTGKDIDIAEKQKTFFAALVTSLKRETSDEITETLQKVFTENGKCAVSLHPNALSKQGLLKKKRGRKIKESNNAFQNNAKKKIRLSES